MPPERHVVGEAHAIDIERDNSNTRHQLGRFTRRTKAISKKAEMVDLTLKLWRMLTSEKGFRYYQDMVLSIYT
ncbi:MAG: hypothetical protein LBF60_11105 [Treponema sp.]|nr:hypothetical protein [Treponema sp.]